jgi:hypothetical protein
MRGKPLIFSGPRPKRRFRYFFRRCPCAINIIFPALLLNFAYIRHKLTDDSDCLIKRGYASIIMVDND